MFRHTEQVTEVRAGAVLSTPAAGQGHREKAASSTAFPNHRANASVVRTNKVDTQFRFSKHCTQQVFSVKKHTSTLVVREFV